MRLGLPAHHVNADFADEGLGDADINAVDNNGETAMHAAAYKNLPEVVKFLAVDAQVGGYISFACRWVPYGATELPLRTLY